MTKTSTSGTEILKKSIFANLVVFGKNAKLDPLTPKTVLQISITNKFFINNISQIINLTDRKVSFIVLSTRNHTRNLFLPFFFLNAN